MPRVHGIEIRIGRYSEFVVNVLRVVEEVLPLEVEIWVRQQPTKAKGYLRLFHGGPPRVDCVRRLGYFFDERD